MEAGVTPRAAIAQANERGLQTSAYLRQRGWRAPGLTDAAGPALSLLHDSTGGCAESEAVDLKTFWQVGEALAQIRDAKLYEGTHGTRGLLPGSLANGTVYGVLVYRGGGGTREFVRHDEHASAKRKPISPARRTRTRTATGRVDGGGSVQPNQQNHGPGGEGRRGEDHRAGPVYPQAD